MYGNLFLPGLSHSGLTARTKTFPMVFAAPVAGTFNRTIALGGALPGTDTLPAATGSAVIAFTIGILIRILRATAGFALALVMVAYTIFVAVRKIATLLSLDGR